MKLALPPSAAAFISIMGIIMLKHIFGVNITDQQVSTVCVYVTGFIRLMFLFRVCIPFNLLRGALFMGMVGIFLAGILLFPTFFDLTPFTFPGIVMTIGFIIFSILIFIGMTKFFNKNNLFSKAEL